MPDTTTDAATPGPLARSLTVVTMTLIWGTTWSAIRVGLDYLPPFTGLACRFLVATLLLAAVGRVLGLPLGRARNERWLWLVHGVFSFCISYGVTYWAEQWVPTGLAAVLFATFPLFVAVLGHFWLPGERLDRRAGVGLVLGFVGVGTIFSEDFTALGGPQVAVGAAVMLLSPLAAAVGNVAVKRWGREVHPISLNVGAMALAASVLGAIALVVERGEPAAWNAVSVGSILYLAVLGSAVAFGLYFWMLQHMAARRLALVAYMIPVVAVTVGVVFLGEPLTIRTVVGAAAVIAGTAVGASH